MVVSTLAWGLGYFGMPHILLHFMAAREENELKISRRVGSIWCVVSLGVAVVIGLVGFGMARAGAIPMPASEPDAENLIVRTAALIASRGAFAAVVAGLILAGILTQNLLRDVCGVKLSEKKSMLAARLTVVGVAILGAIFASNPNSSIFRVVSFAWAGFGATFGPVMLFALFWKRCNRWGAMSGMIAGAVMIFVWKYLIAPLGGVFAIYELLPAFVISSLVIVLVSLCTAKPGKEICEEFDAVRG